MSDKEFCDDLKLPLPPLSLDFTIRADTLLDGYCQRYIRKGSATNAELAMVGKGGFGTAYRYMRDDSFTPMSSTADSTGIQVHEKDIIKDCSADNAASATLGLHQKTPLPPSPTKMVFPKSSMPRNKAPAIVVVKVCRTPTSGSYDELPKTGIGRTEVKIASQEMAAGKPSGYHSRIVRGEARLLRYLQYCQQAKKQKYPQSHVVRLLSDIPVSRYGKQENSTDSENLGPPLPRLLVFERLVELDAELTPRGWAKSRKIWSVEKVESICRDTMAGLKFLHDHNVVHGDLKPSNFMRDAKTGAVKVG